jgi:hypothetical protein
MQDSLRRIDFHLRKWARRKFKRFKQKPKSAREWFAPIVEIDPELFSRTGRFYMRTDGCREPDEPRGSRPVLRERGGETPPRHPPEYLQDLRRNAGPLPGGSMREWQVAFHGTWRGSAQFLREFLVVGYKPDMRALVGLVNKVPQRGACG